MRSIDVKNLIGFNTRMSMYICPSNRANVVAFLQGYQIGSGGECRFTSELSELLTRKHPIKANGLGWDHQIARLAERLSLDWMDVYLLVSSEILQSSLKSRAEKKRPAGGNNRTMVDPPV